MARLSLIFSGKTQSDPITWYLSKLQRWAKNCVHKSQQTVGAYVPQCNADGSFRSEQYWGSTGYCWCVNGHGKEKPGTKIRGKPDCSKKGALSLCQSLQAIIVNVPSWCGPPAYKPDGSFEEVQCCASTGECHCVDREGKEVQGTSQKGKPDCEVQSSKCEKVRMNALANDPVTRSVCATLRTGRVV